MQLLYSGIRKPGLIGQKSDSSLSQVVSAFSDTQIPAGSLVVFDGDRKYRPPKSKDDLSEVLGVVLSEGFPSKANSMLSILRSGRVWVEASDVSPGAPAYIHLKTLEFSGASRHLGI